MSWSVVLLASTLVFVALTGAVTLVCFRQIGLMYLGSRGTAEEHGVRLGAHLSVPPLATVDGGTVELHSLAAEGSSGFLCVIVSAEGCAVTAEITPELPKVASAWHGIVPVVHLVLADEAPPDTFGSASLGVTRVVGYGAQPRRQLDFTESPMTYVLEPAGHVALRKLGGTAEEISRLISAATNERWWAAKQGDHAVLDERVGADHARK